MTENKKGPLLKAEGIYKSFNGIRALQDVYLEVKPGEIVALVGENGAGKSTLMNIVGGVYQADQGRLLWDGIEVQFKTPKEAQEKGIGFVHQELALCQHLTVAENIFVGRIPHNKAGIIDFKKLYADAGQCLEMFSVGFKPENKVSALTVAEQQVVEIAKSISLNCRLIIFDEPTSSLTDRESDILFDIIRNLKKQGISILYISHRMSEIFTLCDRITILRDGQYVNTKMTQDTSTNEVVSSMVGRDIKKFYPLKSGCVGKTILKVRNYTSGKLFNNISFEVKAGEILGISGLVGAGRTETVRAICGIDSCTGGIIEYENSSIKIRSYRRAIQKGIEYITEDRKRDGLFLNMSVMHNISAARMDNITTGPFVSRKKEEQQTDYYVKKLNIKTADNGQKMENLSGGNQQKVMLAKWIATNPKVLFLDEPTRGIDIGAKVEIYNVLRELCEKGIGIIVISSDLPEIIGLCDRVVVMHEGEKAGEVSGDEITEKNIMMLASGQQPQKDIGEKGE